MSEKYGTRPVTAFNHCVTSAIWNEESGTWAVEAEHEGKVVKDTCDL
jgi:cation diffusion facilitator CzcD-associated flavoprotein CzcO